jgi:predicted nucleic acid-binding Zn ribbon protein
MKEFLIVMGLVAALLILVRVVLPRFGIHG